MELSYWFEDIFFIYLCQRHKERENAHLFVYSLSVYNGLGIELKT